ncbi:hypothetical protein JD969_08625 [Planctomycetota bacterium]|nr:hypothetical protein JD969_08625 [Planctomycetota bacterium]
MTEKQAEKSETPNLAKPQKKKRPFFRKRYLLIILIAIYFFWHHHLNSKIDSLTQTLRTQLPNNLLTVQDYINKTEQLQGPNLTQYLSFHFDKLQQTQHQFEQDNNLKTVEAQSNQQYINTLLPFLDHEAPTDWAANHQPPPPQLIQAARDYLNRQKTNIDALLNLPAHQQNFWPIDPNITSYSYPFHLKKIRNAIKHLALYHWLAVHDNKPNESLRALESIHKLAQSLENDLGAYAVIYQNIIYSCLNTEIERGLRQHIYNDAQLQTLYKLTTPIPVQQTALHAHRTQTTLMLNYFDLAINQPERMAKKMEFDNKTTEYKQLYEMQQHLGMLKTDIISTLEAQLLAEEKLKSIHPNYKSIEQHIEKEFVLLNIHTRMSYISFNSIYKSIVELNQKQNTLQLAIAVERFYLANRDVNSIQMSTQADTQHALLPNTLLELVPVYIEKVPTDPYSYELTPEEPTQYKYLHTNNGYLIYTPGHDRTDNRANAYDVESYQVFGKSVSDTDVVTAISFPSEKQGKVNDILLELHPQNTQAYYDKLKEKQELYLELITETEEE